MRPLSSGMVALAIALVAAAPARATGDACGFADAELDAWLERLAQPRTTGNDAHEELIEYLEAQISSISSCPAIEVKALPTSFTRWVDEKPELDCASGVPCNGKVWAVPYSGFTDEKGVTSPLVYAGSSRWKAFHFDRKRHEGKIVLLKIKPFPLQMLLPVLSKHAVPWWRRFVPGRYHRAISLEMLLPSLAEARAAGVRGLIVIPDEDPAIAVDQYVPFTRTLQDVPAIYADRNLGARLIEMAREGREVTLRHEGKLVASETRHVLATLPATNTSECPADGSAIVIATHTDGPNLFEENGVVALWSLLRTFAGRSCRPRDLVFAFAAGHFSPQARSMDDVVAREPELFRRTRAAIVIEHLGARRWSREGNNDASEPVLILTTKNDDALNRTARDVLEERARADVALRPVFRLRPSSFKFGEGKFLEEKGVPTIGYLPNPAYLLSKTCDHERWLSRPLMCKQIDMFRELVDRLMTLEARAAARSAATSRALVTYDDRWAN